MFPQLDLAKQSQCGLDSSDILRCWTLLNCINVDLIALISPKTLYTLFPQLDLATQSQWGLDSSDISKTLLYCVSLVGPCLYNAGLKLRPRLFYTVTPQLDLARTMLD